MYSKEEIAKMFNLDYNNTTGKYSVKAEDVLKLSLEYNIKNINVKFNGLE